MDPNDPKSTIYIATEDEFRKILDKSPRLKFFTNTNPEKKVYVFTVFNGKNGERLLINTANEVGVKIE